MRFAVFLHRGFELGGVVATVEFAIGFESRTSGLDVGCQLWRRSARRHGDMQSVVRIDLVALGCCEHERAIGLECFAREARKVAFGIGLILDWRIARGEVAGGIIQ